MTFTSPVVWALPLGFVLDAVLGDPRGWPHPVRAIGRLITWSERGLRRLTGGSPQRERVAGVVLVLWVVGASMTAAWGAVRVCDAFGSWGTLLGQSALMYWGLAVRSLGREARLASDAVDIETTRRELSWIVGRDTATLDSPAICRACVETVAENYADGVVSPLFWYTLGGPVALWGFKAVSTLDSMVGYRNARYKNFGWAAARLDDLANLLPARLGWLLFATAALLLGERASAAVRVGWRDGRKHPSPNSAWCEAAMAGALGIELGGEATYGGVSSEKPRLGDSGDTIGPETVRRAVRMLWVASLLAAVAAWTARLWIVGAA